MQIVAHLFHLLNGYVVSSVGKVEDEERIRLLKSYLNRIIVDSLRILIVEHSVITGKSRGLVVEVPGEDNVVCGERIAGNGRYILAKLESQCEVVDPLPLRGEHRLRGVGIGIEEQKLFKEELRGKHAGAVSVARLGESFRLLVGGDVENGVVFPSSTFQPGGDLGEVPFAVSWYDALTTTAYAGDGALVTFTFSVADDASAGTTPITVTYDTDSTFDPDENDVLFAVDDQPVTIGERMPGDTDGDGVLSVRDAAVLVRFLVGGWNVHVDLSNADVNGDGKLTLKDVVLIRRSLAGWNVTLR